MFISFEGIDGAGKSTVLKKIAERLRHDKTMDGCRGLLKNIIETREPYSPNLRRVILDADNKTRITELARFFLYQADRHMHVQDVIKPNIDDIILVDRGPVSTMAYQNITTLLDFDTISDVISVANEGIWPDCYIFFNVNREVAQKRLADEKDFFDKKNADFFELLIENYELLKIRMKKTATVIEIDANLSEEAVIDKVYYEIYRYIITYDLINSDARILKNSSQLPV